MRRITAVALAVACAACGGDEPAGAESGIDGLVLLGPTCPVVREGEECPDRPLETDVEVLDANGGVVARARSGADGRFRVALPPGTYRVRVIPAGGRPGFRKAEEAVVVRPGAFARVELLVDSGIRTPIRQSPRYG